ncbi:putative U4/U6 small nuclear ribonucleoprotein Prp3-like [Capsicum annuum]|nr:putative U4/U6 small nuclear ribonucleoprotein Prp3-like [Capsicum annuum]
MGSFAHVEDDKKKLVREVHQLARLGVWLVDLAEGSVSVQNGSESPLVTEVKEKLYVLCVDGLRQRILAEAHGAQYSIHSGATKMYHDLCLFYKEVPVEILDRQIRRLRNKEVPLVNVQWWNQSIEGATWEAEADMHTKYPHLFSIMKLVGHRDMPASRLYSHSYAYRIAVKEMNNCDKTASRIKIGVSFQVKKLKVRRLSFLNIVRQPALLSSRSGLMGLALYFISCEACSLLCDISLDTIMMISTPEKVGGHYDDVMITDKAGGYCDYMMTRPEEVVMVIYPVRPKIDYGDNSYESYHYGIMDSIAFILACASPITIDELENRNCSDKAVQAPGRDKKEEMEIEHRINEEALILPHYTRFISADRSAPVPCPAVRELKQQYMKKFKAFTDEVNDTFINGWKAYQEGVTIITSSEDGEDKYDD